LLTTNKLEKLIFTKAPPSAEQEKILKTKTPITKVITGYQKCCSKATRLPKAKACEYRTGQFRMHEFVCQ